MKFVAGNSLIPVPKVYCSFVHRDAYISLWSVSGAKGYLERGDEYQTLIANASTHSCEA